MSELRSLLSAELVAAFEQLIDERVAAALAAQPDGSPWLTLDEAALYAHVSPRTITRLRNRGRLRATQLGRRCLVHRADLDAFLEAATGEDVAPTTSPRRRV